jgi:hypothetical protein
VAFDMHHCFSNTMDYLEFLQLAGQIRSTSDRPRGKDDQDLLFKSVRAENELGDSFLQATPAGAGSALMRYDHDSHTLANLLLLLPENAIEGMQHAHAAQVMVFGGASVYALVVWWGDEDTWAWQLFKDQLPIWSHLWEGKPIFFHGYADPHPHIFLQQPGDTQLYELHLEGHGAKFIPLGIDHPSCVFSDGKGQLYAADERSQLYRFDSHPTRELHPLMITLSNSFYPPIGMAISNERIVAIRPMHPDYSDIQDQATNYFGGIYTWTREHDQYEPGPACLFSEEQDFLGDGCWDIDPSGRFVVWISSGTKGTLSLVIWDAWLGSQHIILSSQLLYQTTGIRFVGGNHDVVRLLLQDQIIDVMVSDQFFSNSGDAQSSERIPQ